MCRDGEIDLVVFGLIISLQLTCIVRGRWVDVGTVATEDVWGG